jgi:hypothetical protein
MSHLHDLPSFSMHTAARHLVFHGAVVLLFGLLRGAAFVSL